MKSPLKVTDLAIPPAPTMKDARFAFRLPAAELGMMVDAATAAGMTVADFARAAIKERAQAVLAAAEKPKPPRKKKS